MAAATEELGLEVFVEGWQRFERIMDRLDKDVDKTGKSMSTTGSIAGGAFAVALGTIAVNAAMALGRALLGVGRDIVGLGVDAVQTAISYESAFAGVTKTTDGLIDEFGDLTAVGEEVRQGLRDISTETPITFEQLSSIAELGGQLGIERENILGFTQVIADMGETTDLTTDMAATGLAQIANVMGTNQTEFSNMGSVVVELGNNLATTESQTLSFAQRIAGAGAIVGLTEADIFAIGGAFSSVGIKAEAGGTAVQKTLLGINEAVITGGAELETYAQTAGLSADEFITAWEQDAGGAFNQFVVGLGEAGDGAISILKDLGLEDQRLIAGFLSLSAAGPLLGDAMDMANDAFAENNALTAEAAQRYATTESKIEIFKNKLRDTGATLGDMLLPSLTDMIDFFSEIVSSHGPQIQAVFETIAGVISTAAEIVMGFIDGSLGIADFIPIASQVQGVLDTMGAWWADHGPAIQEAAANLFATLIEKGMELKNNVMPFINELLAKFSDWWTENGPLVVSYIELVSEVWSFLITAIVDFWAVIEPILTGLFDIILEIATAVMAFATGDWTTAWEAIKEVVNIAWEAIKESWAAFVEYVLGFLGTTWAEVAASWEASWELFKEIVSIAWENIKTVVSEKFLEIQEAITTKFEEVKEGWTTAWELFKEIVSIAWDNIKTAISEKFAELAETLGLDLENLKERWATIWADVQLIAEEIWSRIVAFVTEQAENIKTTISEKVTEAKETWTAILEDIATIAEEIWSRIVAFVTEQVENMKAIVEEKVNALKEWWGPIWEDISTAVSETWTAIVEAVTEKAQEVYNAVTEKIDEIKAWIEGKVADFTTIGSALIEGLKAGIIAKAQEVIQAVTAVVEDAITAAKSALGMESPSKVFFTIGANLGQGLIDGINSTADGVADAISGLFTAGGAFGTFGGAAASRLKKETAGVESQISDMKKEWQDLENIRLAELEAAGGGELGPEGAAERWARRLRRRKLLREIAVAEKEQVKRQQELLALEKQRSDLAFLKQQADLLDLIKEHGLDAKDILGGLELGIDASLEGIVQAMTAAMAAIVAQVESELEISSPSKVFARIGKRMMQGLSDGISNFAPMVQAQMQAVVRAPGQAVFGGGGNVSSEVTNNFNLTTQSTTRPGGLAMEFGAMQFLGAGVSR